MINDNPTYTMFYDTLQREGINIIVGNNSVKVFARKNENSGKVPYLNIYSQKSDVINQGVVITVRDKPYLVLKTVTIENDTYNKSTCVECNQIIKYMLKNPINSTKATITTFNAVSYDIAESIKISTDINTITSSGHFTLPLTNETKAMNINDRFFAGGTKLAWKIRDLFYQNNMIEVYCDRDNTNSNDDIENAIADRWLYEEKPNTYKVVIEQSEISMFKNETQQLNVSVLKDNQAYTPTNPILWTIQDNTVASIDSTNTITGLSMGNTHIIGNYKEKDTDYSISDSVSVEIKEPVIDVKEIIVNPEITDIKQNRTITMTANLYKNGVIQTDVVSAVPSGADEPSCYTWTAKGNNTFDLKNNMRSMIPLTLTFTCGDIVKVMTVELNAMF